MLRVWLAMGVGVVTLLSSGVVASMAKAQAGGDPAAVITAYEMARNRRDVDAALAYFADDATISQRTTTFSGKDEIRKFLDASGTRSRFVVVSDRHANGTRVSWTERSGGQASGQAAQGPGASSLASSTMSSSVSTPAFAVSVEAIVRDGKIRSLVYLAANQPARVDAVPDGRAQLPASVGLGAVLIVLFGFLAVASVGLRRSSSPSTLRGRLMHDLQGWSAARQ